MKRLIGRLAYWLAILATEWAVTFAVYILIEELLLGRRRYRVTDDWIGGR
jgi:hypothetical protein